MSNREVTANVVSSFVLSLLFYRTFGHCLTFVGFLKSSSLALFIHLPSFGQNYVNPSLKNAYDQISTLRPHFSRFSAIVSGNTQKGSSRIVCSAVLHCNFPIWLANAIQYWGLWWVKPMRSKVHLVCLVLKRYRIYRLKFS